MLSVIVPFLSYLESNSYHLILELILVLLIVYFLRKKRYDPRGKSEDGEDRGGPLTDEEFAQILKNWNPEPLLQQGGKYADQVLPSEPVLIEGPPDPHIQVEGKQCLNLATCNFLGLTNDPKVKEDAIAAVRKYGVGACGPRGFYGTIDVHVELERHLASFFDTPAAIIYSSSYATAASIIPTFAARGDIIIADEAVCHSIRLGIELSRAEVFWFRHNDMAHLESHMRTVRDADLARRRKLTRRWVVVEGIYANVGDLLSLDRLQPLAQQYRWRLLIDESLSVGVLGARGRGIAEHFSLRHSPEDILIGSLGNALAGVGGFAVGSYASVYHQRLNSSGYVFSAASPPYLVVASNTPLTIIEQRPELLSKVRQNAARLRRALRAALDSSGLPADAVQLLGGPESPSPLVHLRLPGLLQRCLPAAHTRRDEEQLLQTIVDRMRLEHAVLIARARYVADEKNKPPPSLRLTISATHPLEEIEPATQKLVALLQSTYVKAVAK